MAFYIIIVHYKYTVRMESKENQESITFSKEQMESLKQVVLSSVFKILPSLMKDITPQIIESAEILIKEIIKKVTSSNPEPLEETNENFGQRTNSFIREKELPAT